METSSLIWPNFKLIQALMYVIITCEYEKDPIKNRREKAATPFFKVYHYCYAMKTGRGRIWPNFELIQAFVHVLIACKYEKDQMKNSRENVMSFSPLSVGFFFRQSRAANSVVHGPISPNFEFFQAIMYIIVACKYETKPIKNF